MTSTGAAEQTPMNADEADMMKRHSSYWTDLLQRGTAVVFGPVGDVTLLLDSEFQKLAIVATRSLSSLRANGRESTLRWIPVFDQALRRSPGS
jgi:hypothetical protein